MAHIEIMAVNKLPGLSFSIPGPGKAGPFGYELWSKLLKGGIWGVLQGILLGV